MLAARVAAAAAAAVPPQHGFLLQVGNPGLVLDNELDNGQGGEGPDSVKGQWQRGEDEGAEARSEPVPAGAGIPQPAASAGAQTLVHAAQQAPWGEVGMVHTTPSTHLARLVVRGVFPLELTSGSSAPGGGQHDGGRREQHQWRAAPAHAGCAIRGSGRRLSGQGAITRPCGRCALGGGRSRNGAG